MKRFIKKIIANYITFSHANSGKILLLFFALGLVCLYIGSHIRLRSDLKELLPPNSKSVIALNKVLEKVGGSGLLVVTVESSNLDANKKFMDDLASKIKEYPSGIIKEVNYSVDEIEQFYSKYALYYLSLDDLKVLKNRVQKKVQSEKLRMTPIFFDFMEGEDDNVSISYEINKFRKKAEREQKYPLSTVDGYFGGEFGRMLIMLIKPYGENLSVTKANELINQIKLSVEELSPSRYDSELSVGYCGDIVSTVEEFNTLKNDILSTSLLCIFLIASIIALYFLRIRAVAFLSSTLLMSLCITSAAVYFGIGYLNAQTAFLGSIIIGTGINYGLILFARYLEERKKGLLPKGAMVRSLIESFTPTFLASATTAVSFSVLAIAKIRGLSQFGFIGAFGVMMCWIFTIVFLPPLILYSEKFQQLVRKKPGMPKRQSAVVNMISVMSAKSPWFIISGSIISAVIMVVVIVKYSSNAIEYDFTKMRNRSSVEIGTEALEKRVSRLFRSSMTPAIAVVDYSEDSKKICTAVANMKKEIMPRDLRVGSCRSIFDLLPEESAMRDKEKEIISIKQSIEGKWRKKLSSEVENKIKDLESRLIIAPPTINDLPEQLAETFSDVDGKRGVVAFINPRAGMLLSDGRNLIKFADQISKVKLNDDHKYYVASASLIFADLLKIIKDEAPLLTVASFVGVIVFIVVMLGKSWYSFAIVCSIVWSVLAMLGVCSLLGLKVNFFNFIVLPLTFGVGADYGINVAIRLRNSRQDVGNALKNTGGAVILCSMTTIIGYYVLTRATNQALASFGKAAVIGEFCALGSAILIVPAILSIRKK